METANKILHQHINWDLVKSEDIQAAMIEFARIHCEAQAKVICEKVKTFDIHNESTGDLECKVTLVDKNSILDAYPLTNIK